MWQHDCLRYLSRVIIGISLITNEALSENRESLSRPVESKKMSAVEVMTVATENIVNSA